MASVRSVRATWVFASAAGVREFTGVDGPGDRGERCPLGTGRQFLQLRIARRFHREGADPLHALPGVLDAPLERCLALLQHGLLVRQDGNLAEVVRHQHLALHHRDDRALVVDLHQPFRAADGRQPRGSADLEALRRRLRLEASGTLHHVHDRLAGGGVGGILHLRGGHALQRELRAVDQQHGHLGVGHHRAHEAAAFERLLDLRGRPVARADIAVFALAAEAHDLARGRGECRRGKEGKHDSERNCLACHGGVSTSG